MTQTKLPITSSRTGKWKPYPAYKDSGVEWLGEIPEHWNTKPLKYTMHFINGAPFKPSDWEEDGTPIIRIENLNGSNEFHKTTMKIDSRYFVAKGDLLFAWSGNRGTSFGPFIWRIEGNYYLNQHIFRLGNFNEDQMWLYWKLIGVTRYVESQAHGIIGLVHITKQDLGIIQTPIIPEEEQRAIATFLDRETAKINTLIAKKERLIELLQEKRAALISNAVTKGLDPAVPMRDSGVEWLGEIPGHWGVRKLKYVASILRGKFSHRPRNDPQMYDGPYPFIQTGDITATTKYITSYHQTLNDAGFAVSKQFPSETLVMAIAANIGDLAILQFPACFPDSIVGFVPASDVDLNYLYYNLTSMKPEMMSTATLNTQLNLNVERIGGLITACPPLPEQNAIATYLDHETAKIDALISKIREGIEKLKEYSTALISAAVTGKIDVRGEISTLDDEHL